jgi:UDP-N-acetylglucosamine diphosphorylase/glucosamine-1-phosphate N-acetyltransferase
MIASDIPRRVETLDTVSAEEAGAAVIGPHPARVERGASIEPYVVFDATVSPILVRRGAVVSPFSRLVGPCYVGEDSTVCGGRVAATAIGEECRVMGELSMTVFLGHANKSHDGFVGHSYLGRWVNLGASTVTSNLKNTYGPVALWTPRGTRDTGMQFLGTMFGDHAKTAIGTRLTTGSVIGAGANVFGPPMAPKVLAPFSWGASPDALPYDVDRFLGVAERVMRRRHVVLSDRARRWLAAAHAARWTVG